MRFLLAILGIYGLYRLLRRERRRGPRRLLQDMRAGARQSRRNRDRGDGASAPHVIYTVVEHDGGWAYKVNDVFSETYATRQEAVGAANHAAAAHQSAGSDEVIEYQDQEGRWHEEVEPGDNRPVADVEVKPAPGA